MDNQKFSLKEIMKVKELGALIPLVLLVVIASLVNPNFMRPTNLFDILKTTSYTTVLAVPLTMLMSSGRMDMSIGLFRSAPFLFSDSRTPRRSCRDAHGA